MGVKITGLDRLVKDIKKAVKKKLPVISADVYKDAIIKNLQPSRKTGALINSWKVRSNILKATITSDMPYAAIQNYGGRIRITDRMRKKMWALYKQYGLPVYKAIAITKKSHITIPPKNYLKFNERKISKRIDVKFNKVTKKI